MRKLLYFFDGKVKDLRSDLTVTHYSPTLEIIKLNPMNIYMPFGNQHQDDNTYGDEETLCGNSHNDGDETCDLCENIKHNI